MLVTPSGIVTLVSPVQKQNASWPIPVTPSGIVTLVSPVQSRNASEPIPITEYPSIDDGISNAPLADLSQSVIIT